MAYILNIHTATERVIVNLSCNAEVLRTLTNGISKDHASFLHLAIKEVLEKQNITSLDLDAIGITSGPGSYTGMRVGLSAAKGLCYALKIPLITYNCLEVMASTLRDKYGGKDILYCPMIDARRMEVYTALYNDKMEELLPPVAMILSENSFENFTMAFKVMFCGSGARKFQSVTGLPEAHFIDQDISSRSLSELSWNKFKNKIFTGVSAAQPLYLKEFYSPMKKPI